MLEISRLKRISPSEFEALVTRLGVVETLRCARTVVIKPNLTGVPPIGPADAEAHVYTDVGLLRDIVVGALVLNPRATVHIAESDSIGNAFAYLKFACLDLPDSLLLSEAHATRVDTLDLSRDRLHLVRDTRFRYFRDHGLQLWLSDRLVDADFVISLSNCKTHTLTQFTGSCKNLFGCLPASDKSFYHPKIHEAIHDVTLAIDPQLSVVDAFFAMEGNGPIFGRPVDCGYRVVSTDAAEADVCACQCAGIALRRAKYLRYLMSSTENPNRMAKYPEAVRLRGPHVSARIHSVIGQRIEVQGQRLQSYGRMVQAGRRPIWEKTLRVFRRRDRRG